MKAWPNVRICVDHCAARSITTLMAILYIRCSSLGRTKLCPMELPQIRKREIDRAKKGYLLRYAQCMPRKLSSFASSNSAVAARSYLGSVPVAPQSSERRQNSRCTREELT